ncbi:MAG: 16S rRNA (uracil(1498)-N(3))-methyltransferase [Holophagales bacterium]|jgi:16S rRNA (uracil1498-N3)-methyltransferase|nr:16S rRNA (uracil(1498)-N(3))-methyltransferase [Holophagales bacterium]
MSLPRLILPDSITRAACVCDAGSEQPGFPKLNCSEFENSVMTLGTDQAKHLAALRLVPGNSLEILFTGGIWRAEVVCISKNSASIRLVAPINENREPPVEIHACLPITAQLGLWDDFLPDVVELGTTLILPVVYERSQYNKRGVDARMERWRRIILTACEQSHRTRIPELRFPIPLEALLSLNIKQRWVAYEVKTETPNPVLRYEDFAFTHGPEGGIADAEIEMLCKSGWKPISLGKSILRAATCPAAILGAVQIELGRK